MVELDINLFNNEYLFSPEYMMIFDFGKVSRVCIDMQIQVLNLKLSLFEFIMLLYIFQQFKY